VAERFVETATNGIEGSGVKPGVIKVGTGARPISEVEERLFRGAALAQRATGLAITTHTQSTALAEEQVELFADAGADLDRVIIGHIGWGSGPGDFALHERLVARGVSIGLDLIGSPARSIEDYVRIAVDLIEAGYASQITLSHDGVAHSRGLVDVFGEGYLSGDFGIVHRSFLPLLRDAGVDEATIELIMVGNPRRLLGVDPERYPGAVDTLLHEPALARL
jgi:phosphotriesterase-related protein